MPINQVRAFYLRGVVFDVSKGEKYYGQVRLSIVITQLQGGSYEMFSYKDASRAFATACLKSLTADLRGLTEEQLNDLEKWFEFYQRKYTPIARIDLPLFEGPIPIDEC